LASWWPPISSVAELSRLTSARSEARIRSNALHPVGPRPASSPTRRCRCQKTLAGARVEDPLPRGRWLLQGQCALPISGRAPPPTHCRALASVQRRSKGHFLLGGATAASTATFMFTGRSRANGDVGWIVGGALSRLGLPRYERWLVLGAGLGGLVAARPGGGSGDHHCQAAWEGRCLGTSQRRRRRIEAMEFEGVRPSAGDACRELNRAAGAFRADGGGSGLVRNLSAQDARCAALVAHGMARGAGGRDARGHGAVHRP